VSTTSLATYATAFRFRSQSETTILLWFHFGNEAQGWGREHTSTAPEPDTFVIAGLTRSGMARIPNTK